MTPREIELLTIAKLEHDGHQFEPVDLRELKDIYYFSFLDLRWHRPGNGHP